MDELLIEDKKYISLKQAAHATGYAKDYVGQLCREGRVPARLIGRNWYVLETALQDHRFRPTKDQSVKNEEVKGASVVRPVFTQTWQSPRYEAAPVDVLPSVNRLREVGDAVSQPELESDSGTDEALEPRDNSWKEWFDRFDSVAKIVATPATPATMGELQEEAREEWVEPEREAVNVPIHAIHQPQPRELLPRMVKESIHHEALQDQSVEQPSQLRRGSRGLFRTIQLVSILLALLAASVAVIGSGRFDRYVASISQARIIAGIELYNK